MKTESGSRTIAFLGNYLPRKCGIATFTSDLLGAVAARHPQNRCFAVAVNDIDAAIGIRTSSDSRSRSRTRTPTGAPPASSTTSDVDVVSLQHEFGIFGGPAGSHLLALLRELSAPVVTTLHTVLLQPNGDQRRVMRELIARSARLVVMTERGRSNLAGSLPSAPGEDRSHPAWYSGRAIRCPGSLQGTVWRERQRRCC